MTKRSNPITVQLSEVEFQAMRKAGLDLEFRREMSVRLDDLHFDALDVIALREFRPGIPLKRVDVIRLALNKYCESLTEGRRYQSFTDLVKDALLWSAEIKKPAPLQEQGSGGNG